MAIEKRKVFPPGKNTAADLVDEWFDTETGRVVPEPKSEEVAEPTPEPESAPAEPETPQAS